MDFSGRVVTSVLAAVLASGGAGPARARVMILDNPIRQPFSGFASSMAVVGDLDRDGVADYVVGAYDQTVKGTERQGQVFVFSGQRGTLLLTIDNPTPSRSTEAYKGTAFGFAVAPAGDVNADGTPDLLLGAFGQDDTGKAFICSGRDGRLLHPLQAPQPQLGGGFGFAVAALGDLSGDGVPEVLIGAFAQDSDGRAYVFEGHRGTRLYTVAPPQSAGNAAFGWSVAAAGDLDHDGLSDFVVGAPYTPVGQVAVQGRAYVFSGQDGHLLYTLDDPQPAAGEGFGWKVAAGSDLNQDGVPDILVGAPYKDLGANLAQGVAFAFSGADGKLLLRLNNPVPHPYSGFGHTLLAGADVNGDGVPELLVGAPFQTVDQFQVQGEVFLFNGSDGRHLSTFDDPYPHQGASFGYSLASPGDTNGDTIPEFAMGASGQIIMDKVAVGRVFVFLSQP